MEQPSPLTRYSRQVLLPEIGVEGQERLRGSRAAVIGVGALGTVSYNEYMLRFRTGPYEIVLFPDGRALINGTSEEGVARSLYARYVGA